MGPGEGVDDFQRFDSVAVVRPGPRVAGEGGGVAADVEDIPGPGGGDCPHDGGAGAGARRVEDHEVDLVPELADGRLDPGGAELDRQVGERPPADPPGARERLDGDDAATGPDLVGQRAGEDAHAAVEIPGEAALHLGQKLPQPGDVMPRGRGVRLPETVDGHLELAVADALGRDAGALDDGGAASAAAADDVHEVAVAVGVQHRVQLAAGRGGALLPQSVHQAGR